MLSIPTLWVVFLINFFALGLVWTHVMRSYPSFTPARYWTAGCFILSVGAGIGMLRGLVDNKIPLITGGGAIVLAASLIGMGIYQFYGRRLSWWVPFGLTLWCMVGLAFFLLVIDSMAARIVIYSVAQAVPIAMALPLMLAHAARHNPGARMAATVSILMLATFAVRSVAAMLGFGGELSIVAFNDVQAAMVLMLVFLSMALNFGLLLMAIDRLRSEVESLALVDDLTGIANRRHLLQRMQAQCEVSLRSGEPFAVLAIDLDGFKAINDSHGHAAGDECLRRFAHAAQSRLRPGDLLARTGGDEFCVVMPATTLREGAMLARRIIEESRGLAQQDTDDSIAIAASIGVAQWTLQVGLHPERLIAAADAALYRAKKLGKDRFAVHEPASETTPSLPPALRKIA
ncbi:GGDEF domain-containing protein [Rhodopseudomonas sp. HC1]|uniref:GGDEF domain-containing protein n=1 Tax=Rhodopseudomonas infernalis TaxID=2897386 RepID=UPI001EE90FD1|nr:GGDEF domain-containing protein [Rhodopseudomonas infernalis]MCG6206232.1 GGDEF domain-containing protein [Rhodopseudomonas infernalis]